MYERHKVGPKEYSDGKNRSFIIYDFEIILLCLIFGAGSGIRTHVARRATGYRALSPGLGLNESAPYQARESRLPSATKKPLYEPY